MLGKVMLPVKPPLGSMRAADGDRPGEESPGCAEAQGVLSTYLLYGNQLQLPSAA